MSIKHEFTTMIDTLSKIFSFPPIENIFFPPLYKGGQPKDAQFMAIRLAGGATGIAFVLVPDEKMEEYTALQPGEFIGRNPQEFAREFGMEDPIGEMIALASINAICQHVMKESHYAVDSATDSMGLMNISRGDRVGMVGLFTGLTQKIKNMGAELIIIEKNERLIHKYSELPITADTSALRACNKILSTSTVVLNNSLDEILAHCSPDAFISIIGPTAGYFPDPLFARGVDVVGGRVVEDGKLLFERLRERSRWGDATQRTCFQKETYIRII